jgi:formate hydrogenlyase subunit 3/multisubunit Na+/H+ antiporter MnhD subunit
MLLMPGTFGEVPFLGLDADLRPGGRAQPGVRLHHEPDVPDRHALRPARQGGREHIAAWTYVAGSLGAIYAGDLLTLFLFWELMAFSSVFLIWFRRRPESLAAGYRYLLVHMAGGVALLAGIILHYHGTGSLAFVAFDVATRRRRPG